MIAALGAHIYAGGFTVGVSKHFNVLAHLEHSGYGADVVKLNFPQLPIYAGGPATWPTKFPERPQFLYANPPCAIWSVATVGRSTHWKDDPRLAMHHDIFKYSIDTIRVDVVAIESVPPSFTKGREHVDYLVDQAAAHSYSTTIVKHNAKWLGVPQNRSRIFYVFHRLAIPWEHPSFGEPTTVRQALRKVKVGKGFDTKLPADIAFLAAHAGPGEGLTGVYDRMYPEPPRNARGGAKGRPSFLLGRAPWDKPSGVVIAGTVIHPEELRYMSQDELSVICGFPKDYKWPKGDCGTISGYMSRGVMPPVGEWLGENIARAFDQNKRLNTTEASVLDVADPPGGYYDL